jgi:hypothetical protein
MNPNRPSDMTLDIGAPYKAGCPERKQLHRLQANQYGKGRTASLVLLMWQFPICTGFEGDQDLIEPIKQDVPVKRFKDATGLML